MVPSERTSLTETLETLQDVRISGFHARAAGVCIMLQSFRVYSSHAVAQRAALFLFAGASSIPQALGRRAGAMLCANSEYVEGSLRVAGDWRLYLESPTARTSSRKKRRPTNSRVLGLQRRFLM